MTTTARTSRPRTASHATTTGATNAMTLTINAAALRRIVAVVEKSAARDDSRPVLAGIQASIKGDRTTLAANGFRLSTAHAALDEPAESPAAAILERAGLLAFAKSLKPKVGLRATIALDAREWRFAANGTAAAVRLIGGTYPDFQNIIGSGTEPVLFTMDPRFLRDLPGTDPVHVSRADDNAHAPQFFTAVDGTRHVVMPMVVAADANGIRDDKVRRPELKEAGPLSALNAGIIGAALIKNWRYDNRPSASSVI